MKEEKLANEINSQIKQDKEKHIGEKSRKSKKKGEKLPKISPEHIAEVRAQREAAKRKKREDMIARGLDPDFPPDLQFIHRPMLPLASSENAEGFVFKLMTYNCLAQALIRRKLFPTSGNALKWFKRSRVLLNEFMHYNSDVLCLQEVDYIQYQSFWKEEFEKLGYDSQFHRHGTKNHGIAIVWKRDMFTIVDKMLIDYDKERSGALEPRTTTKNVGLVIALGFTKKVLEKCPGTSKRGIIVGTTHLFWHPFGTFERTRQCYVMLNKMKEFMHRINVLQDKGTSQENLWYPFFCGDFNSQPFDTPYLSVSSKPITYKGRAKTVIECSTSYTFSKARDGEECDDEEGGNIEKFGDGQPEHPVPEKFSATEEQKGLVESMASLHNSLDMRGISIYSVGYKHVHPENAGLDNNFNEPEISNWAETWRGLLDYIFFIKKWNFSEKINPEELETFQNENGIRIRSLLRMPPAKEMPKHGQPHEGEYGSDHLSMMCELELKM